MKKETLSDKFKAFVKKDGRKINWFHREYIEKNKIGLTYSGFLQQLNGYAPISESVKKQILNYING